MSEFYNSSNDFIKKEPTIDIDTNATSVEQKGFEFEVVNIKNNEIKQETIEESTLNNYEQQLNVDKQQILKKETSELHQPNLSSDQNICKCCNETFQDSEHLQVHLECHIGEAPYICLLCKAIFVRRHMLLYHLWEHCGLALYRCKLCEKGFNNVGNYRKHLKCHKRINLKCETCGKCFPTKPSLIRHLILHDIYECEVCKKRFSGKFNLNLHLRSHAHDISYSCATCGKRFWDKLTLNSHFKTHLAIKCYKCVKCNKSFLEKNRLDVHIQTECSHV